MSDSRHITKGYTEAEIMEEFIHYILCDIIYEFEISKDKGIKCMYPIIKPVITAKYKYGLDGFTYIHSSALIINIVKASLITIKMVRYARIDFAQIENINNFISKGDYNIFIRNDSKLKNQGELID